LNYCPSFEFLPPSFPFPSVTCSKFYPPQNGTLSKPIIVHRPHHAAQSFAIGQNPNILHTKTLNVIFHHLSILLNARMLSISTAILLVLDFSHLGTRQNAETSTSYVGFEVGF